VTKKEIIKKLARKYVELYGNGYSSSDKEDAQLDLLDDIFEECFGIEDLYVDEGQLMSKGKRI
jgi:hypothetical protein